MSKPAVLAPPAPPARISLAITGHREGNAAFTANRVRIASVLGEVLDIISDAAKAEAPHVEIAPTRLHSMLSEGADRDTITREHQLAHEAGVSGVPFMIFDGKLAVSGAEPPQRLVKALDKAVEMAA
jgi:hypothetical protein